MARINMDQLMTNARMYFRGSSGKRNIIRAIEKLASEQTPDGHNVFSRRMYDVANDALESRASLEELRRIWNRLHIFKANPNMKRLAEQGVFDYDDETHEQYLRRVRRGYRNIRLIDDDLDNARGDDVIDRDTGFSAIKFTMANYIKNGGTRPATLFNQEHLRQLMNRYRGYVEMRARVEGIEYVQKDEGIVEEPIEGNVLPSGMIVWDREKSYDNNKDIHSITISWVTHPHRLAAAAPGGCKNREYVYHASFMNEHDNSIKVTIYSPKSKDHNCVTACFAHAAKMYNVDTARDGIKIPKMHKSIVRAANAYAIAKNPRESDLIPEDAPKTDHHIQLFANYFGLIMRRRDSRNFFGEVTTIKPEEHNDMTPGFDVITRPDSANISHYEVITSGAPLVNKVEQVNAAVLAKNEKRKMRQQMMAKIRKVERKLDAIRGDPAKASEYEAAQTELQNLREQQRLEERNMSQQGRPQAIHMTDEEFENFEEIAAHVVTDAMSDYENAWIIDGPGGCGKSYLVNIIQRIALSREIPFACTAMTGAAADRIDNASTLDLYLTRKKHISAAQKVKERLLIIDEISMCDSVKFDEIAMFCKQRKISLIVVGDNFQLPPVQREVAGFWMQGEFFKTFAWRFLHLTQIRRTTNIEFAQIQKRIHDGNPTPSDFAFLASRFVARANPSDYDLTIASRNNVVDTINAEQIARLPESAERRTFAPVFTVCDEANISATRKRDRVIAKRTIQLCIGAHVMFIRNHPDGIFVNGTTGVVEAYSESGAIVRAKVRGVETVIDVVPMSNARPGSKKLVQYNAIPLRLAYAITIHKAQGLTHSGTLLYIADNKFVQPGMYYTAISRVTDPNNLTITGVRQPSTAMLARDSTCEAFDAGDYVPSIAEMYRERGDDDYFAPGIETQPLSCTKKTSAKPGRVFCFDFETATRGGEVLPYLCSYSDITLNWNSGRAEGSRDPTDRRERGSNKYEWRTVKRGVMSDIVGTPANVAEYDPEHSILFRITDHVLRIAYEYEDTVKSALHFDPSRPHNRSLKYGDFARKLCRSLSARCPMISAYNGSSFDLYFIVRYLMSKNTPLDMAKYRINTIMKGSAVVSFTILSLVTNTVILRAHDLCQVLLCPLKKACSDYLAKDDPENQKIEFHAQIMDISANLFKHNWSWADLLVKREITIYSQSASYTPEIEWQRMGASIGARFSMTHKEEYIPAEVIEYCARDSDVLPKLYQSLNEIIDSVHQLSAFSFLTAGGMSWYGGLQAARPRLCSRRIGNQPKEIDRRPVDLYSLNTSQDKFVRKSIIGGRACPRICYGGQKLADIERGIIDTKEHGSVYLDISGMYMSIQERAAFPHGKPEWVAPEAIHEHILKIVAQSERLIAMARKDGMHPIHYAPMGATSSPEGEGKVLADFFIANIEFTENPRSLEPVIPEKTKTGRSEGSRNPSGFSGTRYVLGRRHAIITSYDLLLILLNGGTYHGCKQMLHFPSNSQWIEPWSQRCRIGKSKAKKEGKSSLVAFWKLMSNSFFGQCAKRDHNQEYRFVTHETQLFDFLSKFDMSYAIICEESAFDIVYGSPKDIELGFLSTRPCYIGSFILAYSRAMVQQIVHAANPTNDPKLQPALGDTDSLLIPYEGAMKLREFRGPAHYIGDGVRSDTPDKDSLGWFPRNDEARAGQLTDELMETAQGQTKSAIEDAEKEEDQAKKREIMERVLTDPDRKEEYKSVQMEVIHWFSPAPKVIACIVRDPVTGKLWTKFRTKGVSANARVGEVDYRGNFQMMSAAALLAEESIFVGYLEAGKKREESANMIDSIGLIGDLGSRLKKVSPSSVPNREKNAAVTQTSAFTIRETTMQRKILTHRWNGRAYIGNGITVPHGWAGNGQVAI